ncbi:MAG: VWA domain-containing protein [Verrucomicrobiota bacterium JB023]|nr:VWA domain-containing protein [Verrucomicrobiota bacterium JB023]
MKKLLRVAPLILLGHCAGPATAPYSSVNRPLPPTPTSPLPSVTLSAISGGTITSGLRSGDYAITQNSIDRLLNQPQQSAAGERYPQAPFNDFISSSRRPRSTVSIDVDTASYANFRRFTTEGITPQPGALRTEEMVNYFRYNYAAPEGGAPFSIATEIASCPWNPANRLALIGLRAKDIAPVERPPANLVFLLDVSGSMDGENKLPLVKKSLRLLLEQLDEEDTVAIVTYAGSENIALPPTPCSKKRTIRRALSRLKAEGSTNGEGGLTKAYQLARKNYHPDKLNRVILASDGDFNVGISDPDKLEELIRKEARSGVSLTALGYGMGDLRDDVMQSLAQNGNGQHAYIDTLSEARKALVTDLPATLQTVAKDVKLQVRFHPDRVKSYRLIGYETRLLNDADFADDGKDAGDLGSGHRVTALYELVPGTATSGPLFTLSVRHKEPQGTQSHLQRFPISDAGKDFSQSSHEFRFASSVAAFSQWLNHSPHLNGTTRRDILAWAKSGAEYDPHGYRKEFLSLASKTKRRPAAAVQ